MPVETRAQKRRRLAAAPPPPQPPVATGGGEEHMGKDPVVDDAVWATCAICLDAIWLPRRLACGHCYHWCCLQQWLAPPQQSRDGAATCPMCRAVITERPARWHGVLAAVTRAGHWLSS